MNIYTIVDAIIVGGIIGAALFVLFSWQSRLINKIIACCCLLGLGFGLYFAHQFQPVAVIMELLILTVIVWLVFLFLGRKTIDYIHGSRLRRMSVIVWKSERNDQSHIEIRNEYENKILHILHYIINAKTQYDENQFFDFWDSIDIAESIIPDLDNLLDTMKGHLDLVKALRKEYDRLCKLTGTTNSTLLSNEVTNGKIKALGKQKRTILSAISGLKKLGKSNFEFASILMERQRLAQSERHHKEQLKELRFQHKMSNYQHQERMEVLDRIADTQDDIYEFIEELEEKRRKRRNK